MSRSTLTAPVGFGVFARLTALVAVILTVVLAGPATSEAASLGEQAKASHAKFSSIRAAVAKAKQRKFPYASRTMKMGMIGGDVVRLQKYLNGLAFPTTVDGAYGTGTKRSVVQFERQRTLKVDGAVQRKQARKIRQGAKKRRVNTTGNVFPVQGPHNYGGPGSVFGAPRDDHIHQGQDVAAACGTLLVAASGGAVRANAYQASGAGNYLVITSATTGEDYAYMHMTERSILPIGAVVGTGQPIGSVGSTGGSTGCHLHFEMWTVPGWHLGGFPYDPKPSLLLWDSYS